MKVFCFGELLLRFSPTTNRQWITQANMPVYIGGAELNVSRALANWKMPVKYGTALPDHSLGQQIAEELLLQNIDVSSIVFSGQRLGIYYLPQGAELKNAGVIYDRAGSSFSQLKRGRIDWENVLQGCDWFHFTAISPALNKEIAELCQEALIAAKSLGLMISVDLNYRSKLWQYGFSPHEIMPDLVQHCNMVMGNIWSAEALLNIPAPVKESNGKPQAELIAAATESMHTLQTQFKNITEVAYTFRLDKSYWAILKKPGGQYISETYTIENVIDKAGSGDCFMAGLIYAGKNNFNSTETINFATSAAVGKLYETGDATQQSVTQIKQRIKC